MSKTLRQEDYVRLLMIYFVCYELIKKDRDTLLKSVESESHRTLLSNLELLDPTMENKRFRRRQDEMTTEQYNDYTKRLAASDYEILRTEPKVCTLIRKIHEGTIDTKKYPVIADRSVKKAPAKADAKKKGESEFER